LVVQVLGFGVEGTVTIWRGLGGGRRCPAVQLLFENFDRGGGVGGGTPPHFAPPETGPRKPPKRWGRGAGGWAGGGGGEGFLVGDCDGDLVRS